MESFISFYRTRILTKPRCYYARGITPKDEWYDDTIVEGQPNDKDEMIYKYLNVNLIFDVGTNNKRFGTVVKHSM